MSDPNNTRTYAVGHGCAEGSDSTIPTAAAENSTSLSNHLETEYSENPENGRESYGVRSDAPGWVYLIRIEGGPTKIGMTCGEDPYKRLAGVDYGLPYKTELIAVKWVEDVNRLEKQLHREWAHRHVKGEWFSLDETELKRIIDRHMFMLPDRIKHHLAWLVEHRRDWQKDRRHV